MHVVISRALSMLSRCVISVSDTRDEAASQRRMNWALASNFKKVGGD